MSNDQAKKDYLEAVAEYEGRLNSAAFLFLIGKGYSERKIKKNPDLLERHMDEFTEFVRTNQFVKSILGETLSKMKEAESRL